MKDFPPCPGPHNRRTWLQFGGLSLGIFLLTVVVASADEGGKKKSGVRVDHSSPQKVAESFKTAAARKDWNALFACATKQSQLAFLSGFFLREPDKAQVPALVQILKRYTTATRTDPRSRADLFPSVKSKVALFADLVEWAKKNMPREPRNGPNTIADLFSTIAFKNFRIKGDKATAEVVVEGKSGRLPQFEFRRIDRKWYVHCDFMAAASIDRAALDVRSLQIAMQLYSADHGGQFLKSRKASQQALFALTKSEKLPNGVTLKPYLSKRLKDPWGNIYYYQYPHPKFPNGNFPGIWSAGPDGKSGTKDDIANWNLKRN